MFSAFESALILSLPGKLPNMIAVLRSLYIQFTCSVSAVVVTVVVVTVLYATSIVYAPCAQSAAHARPHTKLQPCVETMQQESWQRQYLKAGLIFGGQFVRYMHHGALPDTVISLLLVLSADQSALPRRFSL